MQSEHKEVAGSAQLAHFQIGGSLMASSLTFSSLLCACRCAMTLRLRVVVEP